MRKSWEYLRTSLWFLPSLIVFSAVCSAILLLEIDLRLENQEFAERWPRLFGAGSDGAREVLSVIAGSVITVAGVAFSITVVVLALASSQHSPRVLRNFMRDWHNQIVLGGFLGIFAYCLVVLRTVRGEGNDAFVPSIAILGSLVLAFLGLALLIYFIHHIASSIHATSIVRAVYDETIDAIDVVFPKQLKQKDNQPSRARSGEYLKGPWHAIAATSTGYIRTVDLDRVLRMARERGFTIKMEKGLGQFVAERSQIAFVNPHVDQETCKQIISALDIGHERTLEQDVAYGIRQLVDVALKGLSPGINDTTSALICIDHLGAILVQVADREIDKGALVSESGYGVIPVEPTFSGLVAEAFNQIRQYGEKNPAVLLRILNTLTMVVQQTSDMERIQSLEQQATLVKEVAVGCVPQRDRAELDNAFHTFTETVRARAGAWLENSFEQRPR